MVDQNEIAKVLKHRTGWEWLPPHNCASININGGVFHETQTKYVSSNVMYNVSTTT